MRGSARSWCSRSTRATRWTATSPRPGGCRRCSATTSRRCPRRCGAGPHWFSGSADAIYQNLNLINDERPDHVAVFGADHIYRMDPRQMIEQHIDTGAAVTVAALRAPIEQADQFGVVETGADGHTIRAFREKPKDAIGLPDAPDEVFASMGNYVFTTDALIEAVTADAAADASSHDMGGNIVPMLVESGVGARVRLLAQQRAGGDRARPRLLARRGDARRLLRRPHGPDLGPPGVQPLQPGVADPHLAGAAAAGQVRLRGRGPRRPGAGLDGVRRGGHLGRDRAALDPLARACTCTPTRGRRLDPDAGRRRRPPRGGAQRDPRQERAA